MNITPNDILVAVKQRFSVLLVDDENQLKQFLRQSLGQYQDLAGVSKTVKLAKGGRMPLPADFLALCVAKDSYGAFMPVDVYYDNGARVADLPTSINSPVNFTYFVNLRLVRFEDLPEPPADREETDQEKQARATNYKNYVLPDQCVGLIEDYLFTLIAIENDDRVARIETLGKMDASRVQTSTDRYAQKENLELAMKDRREILPFVSIHH